MIVPWAGILFSAGMVLGAALDVKTRRSPNWFTVPFWLAGIGAVTLSGGLDQFSGALLGSLVGFALLFVPFVLRLVGGGDVKFAAAMGAWLGEPSAAFASVFVGFVAGGLICAVILLMNRMLRREVTVNLKNVFLSRSIVKVEDRSPRLSVPLVAALAAGGLLIYWTRWGIYP